MLTGLLRQSGDRSTTIQPGKEAESNYGLSQWAPSGQALFMSELARGCLLDRDSTDYLMAALGGVIEEQRWGLGSVGSTAFKGGWGAKSGEIAFEVRQVGLI